MRLSELSGGEIAGAFGEVDVVGVSADSREVKAGYLFAALPGSHLDGLDFVDQAIERGAVAVLAASDSRLATLDVPVIVDSDPRRRLAFLAARLIPGQPATITAVTGTNGKTSVANFTAQIWSGLGQRSATLGTLGVIVDGETLPLAHTTPDPVTLHQRLAELSGHDVECLALEASSHGLDQRRLDGVQIAAAAFTNFGRDHLDYHDNAEDYLAAKLRLFDCVMAEGGSAILNADSDVFDQVRAVCRHRRHNILTYGERGVDLKLCHCASDGHGQKLELEIFGIRSEIQLPLIGDFQAMNALCALGTVLATGGEREAATAALAKLKGVPGRLDKVALHPSGAPVFIDYSHKPDAIAAALRALRPYTRDRLVIVFGCGGDRDKGKRPEMGRIAAELADSVIVTDDNPRTEDPAQIRLEVLTGCPDADEIGDREEAIHAGLGGLGAGDVLLIAGKGHEQGQYINDEVRPFDDTEVARRQVQKLGGQVV